MKKNILFIQPFQFIKKNLSNEPLIWFVYLENFLKKNLRDICMDIIYFPAEDFPMSFSDQEHTSENIHNLYSLIDMEISKLDFNINNKTYICISGISFDFQAIKLISEYFQNYFPEVVIISGGYHASSCPEDFSYYKSPIDYIVVGEGEIVLYNLIKNEIKKQSMPKIIESIPISKLDDLPPLDLSILDKYINRLGGKARGLSISLSRGCPHSCSYCIEESLAQGKNIKRWRAYTPKRAVEETNTLVNYGLEHNIKIFGFLDPCFGHNKDWLNNYLDLYEVDEQVENHFVETRLDVLNKNMISKLQINKMFQFYGVESFSRKMLKIMNKTHNPTDFLNKLEEILRIHKDLEYKCSLGLITNHPGENSETINESFDYLENLAKEDNNNVFNFVPILYHLFPRTYNYDNLAFLNKNFGTKFYFPEWWKDMKTLKFGAFSIRSSTDLPLRESINLFVKKHLKIDGIKYRKNSKDNLGLLLIKSSILKKQQKELLEFLDENNIEMDLCEIS